MFPDPQRLDLQKFSYAYQQIHDRPGSAFPIFRQALPESDFLWLEGLLDDMELPYRVTISNIDDRYHRDDYTIRPRTPTFLANMLYTGNYLVTL